MKTNTKILIGIGIVILILIFWFVGTYNSLVKLETETEAKWANVESSYQRRLDLIPNLVNTVKGYATHEKELFTKITELRSQWASATTSQGKVKAANGLEGALSRLLLVAENYPQLRASENFLALQSQLEGTENRINVERNRYNEAVKLYNRKIRFFPANIVAGMFNFEAKEMFESAEGAEEAPEVTF